MKKHLIAAVLSSILGAVSVTSSAAVADHYSVKPEVTRLSRVPVNVMLIGNSYFYYNCGVLDYMWGFAGDQKVNLRTAQATIAGADLDWHNVSYLLNPEGESSGIIFKKNEKGVLFDAVVLQPNSISPIDPKRTANFKKYAEKRTAEVRNAGSEPLLMMTWARKGKPEMTKQLADAVITEANRLHAMVIPAGLAFARALERDPALNLIMPDNSHPTAIGSYLESAVIYSALTGKSLVGSKFAGGCEKPLSSEMIRFLQEVAWETVTEFYGWTRQPSE